MVNNTVYMKWTKKNVLYSLDLKLKLVVQLCLKHKGVDTNLKSEAQAKRSPLIQETIKPAPTQPEIARTVPIS